MIQDELTLVDEENLDNIVEVEFAQGQDDNVLQLANLLLLWLRKGYAANRFDELVELQITALTCRIRFRYFTTPKRDKMGLGRSGFEDTLGTWFVRYIFARIDSIRKIERHPFPLSDISAYLEYAEPFDHDPEPT